MKLLIWQKELSSCNELWLYRDRCCNKFLKIKANLIQMKVVTMEKEKKKMMVRIFIKLTRRYKIIVKVTFKFKMLIKQSSIKKSHYKIQKWQEKVKQIQMEDNLCQTKKKQREISPLTMKTSFRIRSTTTKTCKS